MIHIQRRRLQAERTYDKDIKILPIETHKNNIDFPWCVFPSAWLPYPIHMATAGEERPA